MAAAGLPAVASAATTIDFGAGIRTSRRLVGAGWQSRLTQTRSDPRYRTRMSGSFTLLVGGIRSFGDQSWTSADSKVTDGPSAKERNLRSHRDVEVAAPPPRLGASDGRDDCSGAGAMRQLRRFGERGRDLHQ